jgi:hypothetical protein
MEDMLVCSEPLVGEPRLQDVLSLVSLVHPFPVMISDL